MPFGKAPRYNAYFSFSKIYEIKLVICVIVYGRNDNYSYALDRRTALGLNQMARQLVVGRDEIIFVDYNSDDDLPTYPEAIADTLTREAIALIRVIRVRPEVHAAAPVEGPPVRESFCRNVALRRIKSETQWVLSTNPDCMLISAGGGITLGALVEKLPAGYFGLPRFELPRIVWETLPRTDPQETARQVLDYANAYALNECVSHYLSAIGYDGPGDFQLASADDLLAIGGFDESMTRGWHVDSNLNARLALIYGGLTNFNEASGGDLALYHTEHSRRISPKHQSGRAEDPFETYVERVTEKIPVGQEADWGAPDEEFEEFALVDPPAKRAIYELSQHTTPAPSASYVYGPESFDNLPPAPDSHLAMFLVDHLAFAKPGSKIGWLREDPDKADWLRKAIKVSELPLHVLDGAAAEVIEDSDILCLEAPLDSEGGDATKQALCEIIGVEQGRLKAGAAPRKIVGLNITHTRFEEPFMTFVACPLTPVSARIRFGEVKQFEAGPIDLMDHFEPGPSGKVLDGKIVSQLGEEGYMAMVRRPILPGHWRVDFTVRKTALSRRKIVMDVALDNQRLAHVAVSKLSLSNASQSIVFESGLDGMFGGFFESRLWVDGKTQVTLDAVSLTKL
ncbi:MAG: hypothetical protein AAGI28_04575 [Pseudomonadota bacterium]